MAPVQLLVNHVRHSGKYYLYIIVGILLFIWGWETPPGILGKADAVGYAFCHRIDLRSFHIGLRQLPLCARCTGQYVGAMLGLLFQAIVARKRAGFPPRWIWIILGLLGLVYAVDGLNSYLFLPPVLSAFPGLPHLYVPSNALRLLTGSGVGLVLSVLLYPALVGTVYSSPDPRPAMGGFKPLVSLLGIILLVDALILTGSPLILYPAALISSLGVVILLTFAYTIGILRIFKRENSAARFSQVSVPLAAAFLLTMSQVAILDLLRFAFTGTWGGFIFG